jgi:hypothetical protein
MADNRSTARLGLKVVHRHRVGTDTSRRVSELFYIEGQPRALLGWINMGGIRTPIYVCALDPAKLRRSVGSGSNDTFYYDGVTVDPRFEDFGADAETIQPSPRSPSAGSP